MESAIAWSRLGLNRVQVNEAVRVSLVAANVAELSAGEATKHLSALMAAYGLSVAELDGVLGMLNNTSTPTTSPTPNSFRAWPARRRWPNRRASRWPSCRR